MFTTHIIRLRDKCRKIIVKPFGDVHRDSNCDEDRWLAFLQTAKKEHTENTFYIGMGDYFDFASYTERYKISAAQLHDSTIATIDDMVRKKCDRFVREIEWMGEALIGLITGNHDWTFANGITATEYMCKRLNCRNLGILTYIRFSFAYRTTTRQAFDIFAHHGKGNPSKLLGTSFNTVDSMAQIVPTADVYIQGHDHRRGAVPNTYIVFESENNGDNLIPKQRQQLICRSGSFLKGYVPNKKTYVSRKLLRPTDLGTITIICEIKRIRNVREKIDILLKELHYYV